MANPIPPITDPQGKSWQQPPADLMDFDTVPGHVIISHAAFKALARYDTTMPSGVYPGKMWKRDEGGVDLLVWFGIVPGKPDVCSIEHRIIMLKELVDLLTSGA
jgi:hypothetical protein